MTTVTRVFRTLLLALAAVAAVFLLWVAFGLTVRTGSDAESGERPAQSR